MRADVDFYADYEICTAIAAHSGPILKSHKQPIAGAAESSYRNCHLFILLIAREIY